MKIYCLIISGPSGSGKTALANKLWKTLPDNPAYLCLDTIKHLANGAIGNDHYLDLARENALSLTKNFLAAEHPIIIEKAFGLYEYVSPFIELANFNGCPAYYFKLRAPLEVLIKRVESRKNLSAEELIERTEWLRSSGNADTAIKIYRFCELHKHKEGIELDSQNNSTEQLAEIIRRYISR